jgi:L-lactate dehydrogenase complex protein LldF
LYCIRCGACLSHCPVYRKIGGHNYPWVYSGPIGAIITPQFHGITSDTWLPFASSLCGACAEVCPVKIEIPKLLLKLREDVTEQQRKSGSDGSERFAFQLVAWIVTHPKVYLFLASLGSIVFPLIPKIGPLKKWTSQRTLPEPAKQSFHQWWAGRRG